MAKKGLIAEVAGWLGGWASTPTYRRSDEGSRRAVEAAVESYASFYSARRQGDHRVTTVRGIDVAFHVTEPSREGGSWCVWFEARTRYARGAAVVRTHAWRGPAFPEIRAARDDAEELPGLDAAWRAIAQHGAGVALVGTADRAVAWVDDPREVHDLVRVAAAVAAIALWDVVLARALGTLPEATLVDDPRLVPAVALAPDGLVAGFRENQTVIAHGGRENVRDGLETDPARLRAAVDAIRAAARGATGPYR